MPWTSKDLEDIVSYFQRVLVPEGVELKINGEPIQPRTAKSWSKRPYQLRSLTGTAGLSQLAKTQVRIVPVINGEVPTVYEMGIPICPLEWDQAYHLEVAQRVPMNPNRDAVSVITSYRPDTRMSYAGFYWISTIWRLNSLRRT